MLKGYKESLEKAIPGNWEIGILSDVSEIKPSNVDKITSSDEAPILLCNYLDVYNNEYIDGRIEFMPATATDKEIEKFALNKGDVIITKDSETPDDIAKPAVVVQDLTNVLCGYHLALIRPDSQRVDSVFLGKMLSSKIVNHQFQRLAQGLTRFGLEVSSIKNVLIAIPTLAEQRKIAEIITTVDEAIEKTDAIIRETQQLKKGLMQKLFTEGIGHTRFKETKIGRVPEEWDVVTLGQILTSIQSGVSRNLSPVDIGVPVIRSTNIQGNRLVLNDLRYWYWDDPKGVDLSNYILDGGDILINFINSVAQIGKCCIFSGQARDFIFTTNIFRAKANNELVSNMYFLMFSQTATYQSQISSITKPAVNQASFTHGDFWKLKVPLPRKEEQDKITGILSAVDAKIETEEAYKSELEQLKKGLMQVLLTGKVRVKA